VLMINRNGLHRTGRRVLAKPFVVLAARCLGPGRLRLEMVKLAHDLDDPDRSFESLSGRLRHETARAFEMRGRRAA
jgi:hypothetical protein